MSSARTRIDLGDRFLRLREERGMTQREAAALVGVDPRQWHRWEKDESRPYRSTIRRVCAAFRIEPEYFESWYEEVRSTRRLINDSITDVRDALSAARQPGAGIVQRVAGAIARLATAAVVDKDRYLGPSDDEFDVIDWLATTLGPLLDLTTALHAHPSERLRRIPVSSVHTLVDVIDRELRDGEFIYVTLIRGKHDGKLRVHLADALPDEHAPEASQVGDLPTLRLREAQTRLARIRVEGGSDAERERAEWLLADAEEAADLAERETAASTSDEDWIALARLAIEELRARRDATASPDAEAIRKKLWAAADPPYRRRMAIRAERATIELEGAERRLRRAEQALADPVEG